MHENCRKKYANDKFINVQFKNSQVSIPAAQVDEQIPDDNEQFGFKNKCLFCSKEITPEFLERERRKSAGKRIVVQHIRSSNSKEGIIKAANRHDDHWSRQVIQCQLIFIHSTLSRIVFHNDPACDSDHSQPKIIQMLIPCNAICSPK